MYIPIMQTILAALIPVCIEWIKKRYGNSDSKLKDTEFESISSILEEGLDSKNRLAIEHLFNRFLKLRLTYPEIESIMNMDSPLNMFRRYKRASMFVELCPEKKIFKFKDKYSSEKKRKRFKKSRSIQYLLFAFIGFFALIKSGEILDSFGFEMFPLIAGAIIIFVPMAILVLDEKFRIENAEEFIVVANTTFNKSRQAGAQKEC